MPSQCVPRIQTHTQTHCIIFHWLCVCCIIQELVMSTFPPFSSIISLLTAVFQGQYFVFVCYFSKSQSCTQKQSLFITIPFFFFSRHTNSLLVSLCSSLCVFHCARVCVSWLRLSSCMLGYVFLELL